MKLQTKISDLNNESVVKRLKFLALVVAGLSHHLLHFSTT